MSESLVIAAYLLFAWAPESRMVEESLDDTTTVTTVSDGGRAFFEWAALLFLALAVWIWRDLLGITSIGVLGGPPIEQQSPEDMERERQTEVPTGPATFDEALKRLKETEYADARARVLEYLNNHHAVGESMLAHDLGIPRMSARALLTGLVEEGFLRRDGFPRRALYTSATSIENRALDYVRDTIVVPKHSSFTERRFVRVQRSHEIDAVLETDDRTFLVEVRFVHNRAATSQIEKGQQALTAAASSFKSRPVTGYLVLVVMHPDDVAHVDGLVGRMTLDTGNFPLQMLVVSAAELDTQSGT